MSSTPWAELRELAKREFKGHYKKNPRLMPEAQPEYIDLAISRRYEGDGEMCLSRILPLFVSAATPLRFCGGVLVRSDRVSFLTGSF